ncbi:MAG: hypothetical protein ACRDZN_05455 [Acidimicrobiales bacterium]
MDAQRPAAMVGGGFSERLERWAAEALVDDAARRRARERWLRQQAEEETSLRGLLVDLAERGTPVAVHMRGGRQHRGTVRAVGADFAALAVVSGDVIVALAAVTSVRTRPGEVSPLGHRPVTTSLRLAEVLAGLAAERERALVTMSGAGDAVAGEVQSVGQDVVVVRTPSQPPATAYVPLDAVGEVLLQRQRG